MLKSAGNMLKLFCLVLCCAGLAVAEIETKMDQLSKHLLKEMDDVWEMAVVNYSDPVINANYRASVKFDMRAMGPLYNSTHMVIDVIAKKQAYPEGIVSVTDGHLEIASASEEWRPLLSHYAGPTAFLVVALLLAAILPLVGILWCCCFWCRLGRRRRPFDRKYDSWYKAVLGLILIGLLTLFLFGVVCLFVSDSQVESGAMEAPGSLRVGICDVNEFLNDTQAHARWLLVTNYRELEDKLKVVLTSSGMVISMKLGEFSRAVSVTSLNKLVVKLDDVQADLRTVKQLTTELRTNADQLNSGLRKVKNQLLQTLAKCDQPKCLALQNKYKIGQLDTEIHYSQMPDVSDLLNNVTSLLNSNIKEEVGAGQQVFRDIQLGIQRSVQKHIPTVQAALRTTGERLEAFANEITWATGNASEAVCKDGSRLADLMEHHYETYGQYRTYAGQGVAMIPLVVCTLMVMGLVCGVCGKRPDVYGASDCCNKGTGSVCLSCGIVVIFMFGGVLSVVLAAYFLVGVGSQRFFCDPLTEPRGNRLFNDLDKFTDLEKAMFNERTDSGFNLTSVLVDWHSNQTIYKSLELHRLYDLESLRAEMSHEIAGRVSSLRPAFPRAGATATILRGSAKDKLTQLAATGLSDFDFDKILHALETNMTSLALDSLARQLNSTAHSLVQPAFSAERASLLQAGAALQDLLAATLQPMQRHTAVLNETALRLRDELRFNHTSLKHAIQYLMHEASEAEAFLNKQGPERLQNMTREFASVIEVRLNEYLDRVVTAARHQVGRTAPLSNAFNATRDAFCNKILMPTNGYWMSLAWCLFLSLPMLVVAQRLGRLYLHLDPYPGPLVEAEYLYDAYADRDNIPLANAYKAEKRTGRAGRGRGREGEAGGRGAGAGGGGGGSAGGGGGGGGTRAERPQGSGAEALPAPLDSHHARRYNDMAPKHWEEGPPRYHGPTEYERPPPYYYPGPTDRQ